MTRTIETDVLVCGLGPAGACAAAAAAAAGANVLAFDRRKEPGIPVQCAEFVPAMTNAETPAVSVARVQRIARMLTYVAGADVELTPGFTGTMIDRARFDQALVARALQVGAECRFGIAVRSVSPDGEVLASDGNRIRARAVIGADGPRSKVGAAVGSINRELAETRQVTVDLCDPHDATDIFLHPGIVGGYAWLFPKGELCNIGLGTAPAFRSRLKPLLKELHERLAAAGRVGRKIRFTTGGLIPVGGIAGLQDRLGGRDVLLCGDAAGLTNPVTGAGINAAVISGRLAGEAAARIIDGKANAARDYSEEVQDLFGRSLAVARRRRRQLLDACNGSGGPTLRDLQRGWIAYPEYWTDDENVRQPSPLASTDARVPA